MAEIALSQRDIDLIGRVVATEVPPDIARRNPEEYQKMVGAVVDTILNRAETGLYGTTIEDILDEPRQFSKITGPSNLNPYGKVDNAPKASKEVQAIVDGHLQDRAQGKPSIIGGNVNYANPNYSSPGNVKGWIDPMIAAGATKFGLGDAIHWHGTAPGAVPANPFTPDIPEDFFPAVDPSVRSWSPDDILPTLGPSPSRPDEFQFAGPKGNFSVAPQFSAPLGPVQRGPDLDPAFVASISPPGVSVPSLPAAPSGTIGRGPSLGAPVGSKDVNGYTLSGTGDYLPGSTISLPPDRPMPMGPMSLPNLNAIAAPVAQPVISPVPNALPAAVVAPVPPPNLTPVAVPNFNREQDTRRAAPKDIARGALRGGVMGGLPGAAIGAAKTALTPLNAPPSFMDKAKNALGLGGFDFNNPFGAPPSLPTAAEMFGFGSGLENTMAAMGGAPFGFTAMGSHPGSSLTSLGPNNGYTMHSDKYGWTEKYGPDGSFQSIDYGGKDKGGGFFSGIFG